MKRASASVGLLLALLLTSAAPCLAQDYEFLGDYQDHQSQANRLTITTTNRPLTLRFFTGGVVEVCLGDSQDPALELSPLSAEAVTVSGTQETLVARAAGASVVITKNPLRLSFQRADGSVAVADDPAFGHGWSGNEVRTWKVLRPDHRFFGLGEKTGPVDKRGRFWTNWNSDIPGYRDDTDPLYCGIPFFSGQSEGKSFGIFFANSYRSTFNLGAGNRRLYEFGADGGALRYYVFVGPTIKDVIARYTELTGRMALPPKWALGYQQCRWSYYPDYEVRDLAKQFRQREIPADVLYFDIHHMDDYKVFSWHPKWFPEPARLLSDLRAQGFKTVTIIDPGVKIEKEYQVYEEGLRGDHFLKFLDGALFEGQVWPGWCHFPDFRKPSTRQWWGAQNARFRDLGVDGFWNDMNEPALWGREMPFAVEGIRSLHNVFGLLMAQATYEGLLKAAPHQRPFLVTRAGWAGIQRYSAVWTGDNSATWEDLALSIRLNLGLGLSGVPLVGCDVGGFIGRPDPELYTRWMQAASFSPFFRSHTVQDSPDQEPWSFGEETERRCKEAIVRRYSLLPYLYSELHRAHESGLPILRPLWLEWPQDQKAYAGEFQHQFLVGEKMMVAPVITAGQRFQKVYLPAGDWFEPATATFHSGDRTVVVEASLDALPLFYLAGAIIPSQRPQQYVDEKPLTELELTVVPGAPGRYEVVFDDGLSVDAPQERLRIDFDGQRKLSIDKPAGPILDRLTRFKVKFAGRDAAVGRFDGRPVSARAGWLELPATSGQLMLR
jgi:alpha-glucosidase